ncbi:helix-turn-helix transcriptional regulator [Actinoplanes sp. NPDC023714]|uniref:helix-turn-helix domain-containing protein n=1 Tax=Actinoplanes sp. NPDC023714 TaxID=3154322 RepID=UPI0034087C73
MSSGITTGFSGITTGEPPAFRDAPAVLEPPDPAITLTWRLTSADPRDIVITGPRTRAGYRPRRPGRDCLQMRLPAGIPMNDIAGLSALDLAGLFPRDPAGRVPIEAGIEAQLTAPAQALPPLTDRGRLVAAATGLLSRPRASVSAVARHLSISERHLRTLMTASTGLTPSHFIRLARVRAVLARIDDNLTELAVEAGYYDQSHMIAEFRRVMGTTPYAFARRRWPAARDCPSPGQIATVEGEEAR